MKKFIMSYSCGKDSTLALYRMIKKGFKPVALLVTVNKDENISCFHGIPNKLIEKVAGSLDLPLLLVETSDDDYNECFRSALRKAKEMYKVDACVFGDIDIELHRTWCTDIAKEANLEAIFPLWQCDREELVYEFIDAGFKAIVKKVRMDCLGEEYLGKVLTRGIINDIKGTGADPCGENGEYHTFVFDGPLFSYKVNYKVKGVYTQRKYGFLEIEGNCNE